jgi:hypothetical protein
MALSGTIEVAIRPKIRLVAQVSIRKKVGAP